MVQFQNKKKFRDQTEATLFQPGTVPVPVLVLPLMTTMATTLMTDDDEEVTEGVTHRTFFTSSSASVIFSFVV